MRQKSKILASSLKNEQTKADILDINGKKAKEIALPKFFSQRIREDLIAKILEIKKTQQPFSPSPVGGKQHSASGKIIHRRHVWKSGYGRGASRVPRKMMSRRGSQFNWVAAEIPSVRGGRRAHPPKILSMFNRTKANKKELRLALISSISATANEKKLIERYDRLDEKKLEKLPLIVESKIVSLKTKDLIQSLEKILGKDLLEVAIQKKSIRSGKGKLRGRKYKSTAGLLFVIGEKEKLKVTAFDVKTSKNLSVVDLAKGGPGRLTLYTEQAIKELEKKFGENKK